jgi:hypothetical protein
VEQGKMGVVDLCAVEAVPQNFYENSPVPKILWAGTLARWERVYHIL